ncbi:hypothetical protein G7K_3901-t1 [Saitoella complicata NRRL Y-17804]|uniref:Uncharacterized protein n=1 Tax=Saitoella complicata (strain BCRC 22490 / CBS 7301 / JCM 7358 / NBRC 10748 / NRRL Y-17804) TaxID=698492 RepID=A0A0E9NIT6_SAICN|nr:hypothetical protein G7K_3901-t1 [Saitoella complicata NRRL Y-17804]
MKSRFDCVSLRWWISLLWPKLEILTGATGTLNIAFLPAFFSLILPPEVSRVLPPPPCFNPTIRHRRATHRNLSS